MTEVREILGTPEYVGESDVPHLQTSNALMHGITAAKKKKRVKVKIYQLSIVKRRCKVKACVGNLSYRKSVERSNMKRCVSRMFLTLV